MVVGMPELDAITRDTIEAALAEWFGDRLVDVASELEGAADDEAIIRVTVSLVDDDPVEADRLLDALVDLRTRLIRMGVTAFPSVFFVGRSDRAAA
jgi:hypothetical protein